MSYKYETQWDSPSYTPASFTRSVWGVDRNIIHIDIHWWDAPEKNPTYEGTIATLVNPAREASAHFIATGTGRRVACLVNPDDNSWATNQDNPYSISIECDPRCRPEDYDVVAELIANIRSAYGNLSLHGHREFVSTTCPGNWDLNRLEALSRTKDGSGDWGDVHNIVTTPPIVVPPVVIPPVPIVEPPKPVEPPIVVTPPVIEQPVPTTPVVTPQPIVPKRSFLQLILDLISSIIKLLKGMFARRK